MKLDDRIEQEKQRRRKKRNQILEDEETMDYLKREAKKQALNESEGVFTSSMAGGINTEKSVFDRQALFFHN